MRLSAFQRVDAFARAKVKGPLCFPYGFMCIHLLRGLHGELKTPDYSPWTSGPATPASPAATGLVRNSSSMSYLRPGTGLKQRYAQQADGLAAWMPGLCSGPSGRAAPVFGNGSSVSKAFTEQRLQSFVEANCEDLEIVIRVCLCRDLELCVLNVLEPDSVVLVGGKKRWLRTRNKSWPACSMPLASSSIHTYKGECSRHGNYLQADTKLKSLCPLIAPHSRRSWPETRATKVVIATTAMLSFISFWRAAAIVLNDSGRLRSTRVQSPSKPSARPRPGSYLP